MLKEYERVLSKIPHTIMPMMKPHIDRVEDQLSAGVSRLSWTSLNVKECECVWRKYIKLNIIINTAAANMISPCCLCHWMY